MFTPNNLNVKITTIIAGLVLSGTAYFAESKSIAEKFAAEQNILKFYFREDAFQNEPESMPVADSLKIPIFIYHSVRPYTSGESTIQDTYDITPQLFEQQLAYLHDHNFTAISLDDLAKDVTSGTTSPIQKPVILTFDDGWENQYTYAFPLLKKYHMTATFYVFADPIGKKKHFLTWNQLREMDEAGMVIASHTLSHPYLQNLSADELKKEIVESKHILETELAKPILHFASPFGYTSPEIIEIIKDAGYKTARTTYKGIYQSKDNLLQLRGILVNDDFNYFIQTINR